MMKQYISELLKKLHSLTGNPRLEIEGLELSMASLYLNFFPNDSSGIREKRAIYVLKDFYDESGGGSNNDWDYIIFPKSELERLLRITLGTESKEAKLRIPGSRITFSNHWNCQGEGWEDPKREAPAVLSASLKIRDGNHLFQVKL